MNIRNYFNEIKEKIYNINSYVSNPLNYTDLNNPFASTLPKTYVWVEDDIKKANKKNSNPFFLQ
ncbi:MAG: hypothetical protein LUH11_03330 [Candidatus Gastranaerophilales bacterium]|nr:hypothetical protein [Candidatus Gastranaerophilales bacterium]